MSEWEDVDEWEDVPDKSTLLRKASMVNRGALPVVTGATAGGALGLPFGAPGVLAGTVAGGMGLPLADAAATGWNYINPFNKYDVGMPSEYASNQLDKITPYPETTEDRMYESGGAALGGVLTGVPAAGIATNTTHALTDTAKLLSTAPKTQTAVAVPSAMASQYVTEKTDNPLLGAGAGVATSMAGGALTPKVKPVIPTKQQIKANATKQYDVAKNSGVVVKPDSFNSSVDNIVNSISEEGFHAKLHPKVSVAVNELRKGSDEPLTISRLDQLRRIAKSAASSNEADEKRVGSLLVQKIDDYVENLGSNDLISGDSSLATNALKSARNLWKQNIKTDIVENALTNAKNQAGAQYTNAGLETALRQQFKTIANNPKKLNQFSAEEQKQIIALVRGGKGQNALRLIGKLAPTGIISSGFSSGAGYAMGGATGAIALPMIGFGAREAATKIGMNKFNQLDEMIRLGSMPKKQSVQIPMAIRGLLSSQY